MRQRSDKRVLAAVLFTDVVDSTETAGRVGDARWKELIARHHAIVRQELKRYGGRELDTAGDGFFASFGEPAAAIRCACAASTGVRRLGIEIRAGVHFGECEQVAGKLGGLTVVVGARVMALGEAGDVLATGTVRELVGGAGFGFQDRGRHPLKGVEGEWPVVAVTEVDGVPRPAPADPTEAERRLRELHPRERPRPAGLVAAAFAALVVGVISFLALREEGSRTVDRIPAGRVGRIDPVTDAILAPTIDVGAEPTSIAVGSETTWVAHLDAGIVTRLDHAGGSRASLSTGGHPVAVVLDEEDFVWALNGFEATLVRIDPNRMEADRTVQLATGTMDLATGAGALWVTNALEGAVIKIDLETRTQQEIPIPKIGEPSGVDVGEGAVWVSGSEGIARVDPVEGTVESSWPLRFPGGAVAVGAEAVWVTLLSEDQVAKIVPTTGPSYISVGNGPIDVTVGGGAVWVTNNVDGTVSKIDPTLGEVVRTIVVGNSPEGVAFGDGSVWVAVHR